MLHDGQNSGKQDVSQQYEEHFTDLVGLKTEM